MDICIELLNMVLVNSENAAGIWLREKREAKSWSQQKLCDRAGIGTKSYVSQIENGRYVSEDGAFMQPDIKYVEAWADALGESRNAARRIFGYAELEDEMSVDEVAREFRYMLPKYKQLPDIARAHVKRIVGSAIDLALEMQKPEATQLSPEKVDKTADATTQTIRYSSVDDLRPISLDDAKALNRKHKEEKTKGPKKGQ